MAEALFGGAALGAVFSELLKAIIKLGKNAIDFNPVLEEVKTKVHAIIPLVKEIDELNEELDYPKEETKILRELIADNTQLLLDCDLVKLKKINYVMTPIYTVKLRSLNDSIRSFMDILLMQMCRDQKKNLKMTNQLMEIICRLDRSVALSNPSELFVPPCLVPEIREEIVGLDETVEKLKVKLLKDGIRLLIVTAPGGCGKTTLALKFCHDKQVKEKFQKTILFLTVSRKPDFKLILKSIIQRLRGIEISDFQNDENAFWYLELMLKQMSRNPVLIVLDDVWESSESEKLLEKFILMSNCKILVTSRFKFPRYGEPFDLEPLNHGEAMQLFHRALSNINLTPRFPDEEIVEKIVRGCKRFPLALKLVARTHSGKPTSFWRATEKKLLRGDSILGSEKELLDCLQRSLDALSGDNILIKESLMDLGSFPEDQRIRVDNFIDMCAVMYKQDESEAMSTLDELSRRTFIDSIAMRNDDDCHSESYFTQHDILRDFAIHLTDTEPVDQRSRLFLDINTGHSPQRRLEKMIQSTNARLLSITTDEMFSSLWHDMEAPEVEVLILNLRSKAYRLPDFMKRMSKLKALIITNYGSYPTELTYDHELINCQLERIRLERISIPPLGHLIPKPLINLQKVSFFMCRFDQNLLNRSTHFSNLMPNLLEISINFCNDLMAIPIGLCEITNLEKLSITNCHGFSSLPEELGKLSNLRTLRLRSCIHLEVLPDSTSSLRELEVLDISHCIGLMKLPEKIGELHKLRKLNMWSCPNLLQLPQSLKKLRNLTSIICDRETSKWLQVIAPRLVNLLKEQVNEITLDWLNL